MSKNKIINVINIILPVAGIALMTYYAVCDTICAYISGSFLGIDLKIIGILFMAVLLILTIPAISSCKTPVGHLRTMMLAGAMGGEVILFRFQVVHEAFCPFCLAFGLCLLILFAIHFKAMNKYLAGVSFLAGLGAFALFFKGSVLPLY
jgi:uncharacterized membrane protein